MQISLKVSLLVAALGRERAQAVAKEILYRDDNQRVGLDITKITKEEVEKIEKVAATENTALARRISSWKDLRADPDTTKCKSALQLETALIAFVRRTPHKILFHRSEDGQMLPYFVTNVVWHKKRIERSHGQTYIYPAYVVLWMQAYKGTSRTSISSRWSDDLFDEKGPQNVRDLLEGEDLFPENDKSFGKYEVEVARHHEIYRKTGAQFHAHGRGYGDKEDEWAWGGKRKSTGVISFTREGVPSRVCIDPFGDKGEDEEDDSNVDKGTIIDNFWPKHDAVVEKLRRLPELKKEKDDEDDADDESDDPKDKDEVEEVDQNEVVLPLHPYIQVYDFETNSFMTGHVRCFTEYEYQVDIQRKLILPQDVKKLVTVLIAAAGNMIEDIVVGKTGGVIVMCTGEPGVGKTLTAEVFSEQMKIPIYTVQCSQLGTSSEELETQLIVVLKRAMRWGALLLLDEADVYTRTRENDLEQNAIVGVFLRLLERYRGILFMTSNRDMAIDDAILSRCIAHIRYELPTEEDLVLIWEVLSEQYKLDLTPKEFKALAQELPGISGRNVKTLIKLVRSVANKAEYQKGEAADLVRWVAPYVDFPKSTADLRKAAKKKG